MPGITQDGVLALGFIKCENVNADPDFSAYQKKTEHAVADIGVLFVNGSTRHPTVMITDDVCVIEMDGVRTMRDIQELYRLLTNKPMLGGE